MDSVFLSYQGVNNVDMGFSGGPVEENSPANAGDAGLIPASGRFPGEGNGNSLQNSCLENSMDRGHWQATVHGVSRVKHNLETKPAPPTLICLIIGEVCSDPLVKLLSAEFSLLQHSCLYL